MSTKQTFGIIDGVYEGPEHWEKGLDLRKYKDTLISLGNLKAVGGCLYLRGCTSLKTLGNLETAGGGLYLDGCSRLTTLGNLEKVGGCSNLRGCMSLKTLGNLETAGWSLDLRDCTNLTTLSKLKALVWSLDLRGCVNLTSLGVLKTLRDTVWFNVSTRVPLKEVQKKVKYYSSLQAHEALNIITSQEVQEVPLYRNILMKILQN